jgi:tetratricopeptide (TPR) repeat protein
MSRVVRGSLTGAALATLLMVAGARAGGQPPPAQAGSLERAAELIQARAFGEAAATLRQVLAVDPGNRRARELLAFSLEASGDLEGERRVRSALAAAFPDDPGIQADLGRVMERSGDERAALQAYLRARALDASGERPELDAAIERMKERTATELGAPLVSALSDPDASAAIVRAGAAIPVASRNHLTVLASRYAARARRAGVAPMNAYDVALSLVGAHPTGGLWMAGPRLHAAARAGETPRDPALGGAVAGRVPLGRWLEADVRAEAEVPWDEAAVAVLNDGRTTAAEARLYLHALDRRLLVQAGARRRRLSILGTDSLPAQRPLAWQSLAFGGADLVLWNRPGAAMRGQILDESLIAPTSMSSAVTLAYRHYEETSQAMPAFAAHVALAPHAALDELSTRASLTAPGGALGLALEAGVAMDAARSSRSWRAGGSLTWAPRPRTRCSLEYAGATEVATGLVGRSREGRLSVHMDL